MVFKYNIFWRAILEKLNCTKCLGEKLIKSAAARGVCILSLILYDLKSESLKSKTKLVMLDCPDQL